VPKHLVTRYKLRFFIATRRRQRGNVCLGYVKGSPMTEQRLVDDIEYLRRINVQLADWELQGPHASRDEVAAVLDERFLFRRAKGGTVDRDDFVAGLADKQNRSDELVARVGQIQILGEQAFVEVFVFLDGLRGGNAVKGWFRNLRVWEKQSDGQWRCVFWFNKPLVS
jgi:ketosteroid isomerase-like protein